MRQKRVRSATDEHGHLLRDEHGHPILIEEYIDKGPRLGPGSRDTIGHNWARVGAYCESMPPNESDVALTSSWPTPVPNRRRTKVTATP